MSQEITSLTDDQVAVAKHLFGDLKWPFSEQGFGRGLGADDVLLADRELVPFLTVSEPACQVTALEDFAPQASGSVTGSIYVLSRSLERRKVRDIAKAVLNVTVLSATYESDGARLAAYGEKRITLLSATRHSGAKYLSYMLVENNFCRPIELLTHAQRLWAALQQDFNPIRAALTTLSSVAPPVDHNGDIVFQFDPTDFAETAKRGQITDVILKRFLKRVGAQAIYFVRRNKTQQGLICESLSQHDRWGETDLCALKKKARKLMPKPHEQVVRDRIFELVAAEAKTESVLKASCKLRMVTFEELIESPVEVMKMMGPFLGQKRLNRIRVLDASPEMMTAPWFETMQVDMRTELIRFLGLKRTKFGSFTTETLEMLESEGR